MDITLCQKTFLSEAMGISEAQVKTYINFSQLRNSLKDYFEQCIIRHVLYLTLWHNVLQHPVLNYFSP